MCSKDELTIALLLEGEEVLLTDKVQFEVEVSNAPRKAHMICTASRLLLYVPTPMGLQLTLVRYEEIERMTTGKKKGHPYVQFLGDASRVLVLFRSKKKRDAFRNLCRTHTQGI